MLLSKWAWRDSNKSRFTKNQETSGLSSNLRLKTRWSKIPLIGDICFGDIKWMKQ